MSLQHSAVAKPICKVFGEIPVSPNLKSRVRQRLYSLVNNIDGYIPNKDNTGIESQCRCKEYDNVNATLELNNHKNNIKVPVKNINNYESPATQSDCLIYKDEMYPGRSSNDSNSSNLLKEAIIYPNMNIYEELEDLKITDQHYLWNTLNNFNKYLHDISKTISLLQIKVVSIENGLEVTNGKHEADVVMLKRLFSENVDFINQIRATQVEEIKVQEEKNLSKERTDITKNLVIKSKTSPSLIRRKLNALREEIEDLRIKNIELKLKINELKYHERITSKSLNSVPSHKRSLGTCATNLISFSQIRHLYDKNRKANEDSERLSTTELVTDLKFQRHVMLTEYRNYIRAQLHEYKKAIHYWKKKCVCPEKA